MERPRHSLRTRRRSFLGAVRIAHAAEVLRDRHASGPDDLRAAFRDVAREVTGGWARWGRMWGGPDWGLRRLLYADHRDGADHAHGDAHTGAGIAGSAPRHRGSNRAAAGYLVTYNAACFLSLALGAQPPAGSVTWSADEWREDCARAAVVQLNTSLRVTRSQFSAAWAERDTDLRPLFTGRLGAGPVAGWGEIGRNWARFTGIDVTEETAAARP
ncbi:hypothetical protein [Streptomyces sp. NPDC026673]|uniref:hypothetical protein n=1 Tax=Streptomyces sp. NPDC026673 TaxID=3155724 RepID=UPI0033F23DE6